jgi:hypothetical protein
MAAYATSRLAQVPHLVPRQSDRTDTKKSSDCVAGNAWARR